MLPCIRGRVYFRLISPCRIRSSKKSKASVSSIILRWYTRTFLLSFIIMKPNHPLKKKRPRSPSYSFFFKSSNITFCEYGRVFHLVYIARYTGFAIVCLLRGIFLFTVDLLKKCSRVRWHSCVNKSKKFTLYFLRTGICVLLCTRVREVRQIFYYECYHFVG